MFPSMCLLYCTVPCLGKGFDRASVANEMQNNVL